MHKYLLFLLPVFFSASLAAQEDSANQGDSVLSPGSDLPSATVSADELENEMQSQDISGLLQASGDVFSSVAGFHFSAARFRVRGYGSEHYDVMLNGVRMNNPETGWAIWNDWGGMNDITRYQDSRPGIAACQYRFSGIGGFSNIDMRASHLRKGTKLTYSLTNRSYRHRVMFTHSTGMTAKGWAATLSLSTRQAAEGYVEGTSYSGMSYFLSLEKKAGERHNLCLVAFGAPTIQGRAGLAVQEAYELADNNYYNPYWGYQNGEKRNARMRNNHKPVVMFSDVFKIREHTSLSTTAYAQAGRSGQTSLTWYDARDPRPDYYRYLPSYYEEDNPLYAEELKQQWANDPALSQINWDQLYFANMKNLYTLTDADGQAGNDITGNRSKYMVEEYRSDPLFIGLNSVLNTQLNDKLLMSGGIDLSEYSSRNFMVAEDLLGGDFWVDVDQFAEQDFADQSVAQNDLNNTNNVVYEGDKFGYDYDLHLRRGESFVQTEWQLRKVDIYLAANLSYTLFWRNGRMKNGRFPENSFGNSEAQQFINWGAKAGAVYKITGRHFISANAALLTRPPAVKNAFLSPRINNELLPGLESEQVVSGDINYHIRYPRFRMRLSAYYTEENNGIWNRSFWHDELRTYVNYTMTDVDKLYTGVEIGAEANVLTSFTVTAALATGQYLWNSRPFATITADNTSEVIAKNRLVYLTNYRLGWTPQTAASLGVKYSGAKFWFAGANFNWFDDIWLDVNPDRRTEEAVSKYVASDPQWNEVLDQTKLEGGYTLDLFAGKSFRIRKKYYLFFMLSASNLLNNTALITGGYEQLRYDPADIGKFPPKYAYMYGITYYAMTRLSF